MQYRLLKPIDLEKNPDKKYPMVLSLHGAGGTGTDNVRNLRYWNTVMAQEELRRKHPCFVVAPQSVRPWRTPAMAAHFTDENIAKMPKDWQAVVGRSIRNACRNPKAANLDRVFLLLDALAKEFPIDTDRVYVLGHSMGGFGTWTAVAEQPDRFAAAITVGRLAGAVARRKRGEGRADLVVSRRKGQDITGQLRELDLRADEGDRSQDEVH